LGKSAIELLRRNSYSQAILKKSNKVVVKRAT
jgi:hypothetical protein